MNQKTLAQPCFVEGIGLHSGNLSCVRLLPAEQNSGIRFIRTDLPGAPEILAVAENVVSTHLATTIAKGTAKVSTIEHLMAALAGLGISNLVVEVEGPEVPIVDGSALPFVEAILEAGILDQIAMRQELVIKNPISITEGEKCAHLIPADSFKITSTIEFKHPLIGRQSKDFLFSPNKFCREVANARTFGFLRDVEKMREHGLALGGSLDNAIVLDDDAILNPEGLRSKQEFVCHKILDAIGDLALLGYPIRGHLITERAGHDIHYRLIKHLLSEPDAWLLTSHGTESRQAIF